MRLKELWLNKPIFLAGNQNTKWQSVDYEIEIDESLIFITHNKSGVIAITTLSNLHFATPDLNETEDPLKVVEQKIAEGEKKLAQLEPLLPKPKRNNKKVKYEQ